MLTLHVADNLSVLVEGDRIAALGPDADHPGARVRRWHGTLTAGRLHEGPPPDAPSARERIHALLRTGATAVSPVHLADLDMASAAHRNGVTTSVSPLTAGSRADFAVFAEDGTCVATVVGGRLVHRRV